MAVTHASPCQVGLGCRPLCRLGLLHRARAIAVSLLYPQQYPGDLREVTKDFYKRFYKVDLTQQQVDGLLASATAPKK